MYYDKFYKLNGKMSTKIYFEVNANLIFEA